VYIGLWDLKCGVVWVVDLACIGWNRRGFGLEVEGVIWGLGLIRLDG